MKYIVLGGGISPENEVSTRSAAAVQSALEALGHDVTYLDPAVTPVEAIVAAGKEADGIFPILHGAGGEDGALQQVFDREGVAYFGPDYAACANTFNKVDFKRLLEKHHLPTPVWAVVSAASFADEPLTRSPFVLKPIDGGSSIDTFIIRDARGDKALVDAPFDTEVLLDALNRHGNMLIEELILGDETTVGVLDKEALPVIEIIPPQDKEFDYENKYNGATQELCPPEHISAELQDQLQTLALAVHEATACRHLSRTDILINKNNELFIIDTNTIPGLTSQSLYPKSAQEAGYEWNDLVEKFASMI